MSGAATDAAEQVRKFLADYREKAEQLARNRASDAEKVALLEKGLVELKEKVDKLPPMTAPPRMVYRDGEFVEDVGLGLYRKAIMSGRARGHTIEDLWRNPTKDPELKEWQQMGDCYLLAGMVNGFRSGINLATQTGVKVALDSLATVKEFKGWRWESEQLRKALTTSGAGTGLEFVPTEFSSDLQERVALTLRVAGLHRRLTIPRSPFQLPVQVAGLPKGFKVTERTTDNILTEANKLPALILGTRKITFTAQGVGGLTVFSTEFEEDSIVPAVAFARDELVTSIANAQETAILNGSRAATHPDNDTHTDPNTSILPERLWDGYREISVKPTTDTTLDFGGVVTASKIRELRAKMKRYGVQPSELAYVVSAAGLLKHLINMPEVLTLDKLGPQATILTGQLAQFDGSPVLVSDFARDDLSATGFNTVAGPNTKTSLIIVRRGSLLFGEVRAIRVDTIRWGFTEQIVVMAKMRADFVDIHDMVSQTIVAMGINIAP